MKNIEVYGTGEECIWCVRCCEFLDSMGEEYIYKNVREDEDAMTFIKGLGLRSVPQVFIDGVLIGGYTELQKELS